MFKLGRLLEGQFGLGGWNVRHLQLLTMVFWLRVLAVFVGRVLFYHLGLPLQAKKIIIKNLKCV